ncbi:MAG: cyclic nucleotide-binding domain-containing protein [Dehalococcoidia bacterium]
MPASKIKEALHNCEIFSELDEETIEKIAELSTVETYEAGETVITQGEYGTRTYLIAEGQVALTRLVNIGEREAEVTIDILGKGRGMGWASFLCEPCGVSATAKCQKPATLVVIEGASLRAMLKDNPEIGFKVMDRLAQVIANRLRAAYGAMDTFK